MLRAILLCFGALLPSVLGHGRLIEPPSRASAWRYGFDTPHNYNDHELYCGGFSRQWLQNAGQCGVCGDAWDAPAPRAHEYGGTYGQGIIVRKYGVGAAITIRVELTANHQGHFEFGICPDFKTATQWCIEANLLRLVRPQEGTDHKGVRYFPKEGNRVYEIKYRLPKKTCEHCLLQWRYIAANNWGNCFNGTEGIGCGPQEEFRACADITIKGKATDEEMELPTTASSTTTIPTTTILPPYSAPSYNPISTLIISLVSFLLVFLTFFLIYFHFYQVGKQIKNCLKRSGPKQIPPMPPPRSRRTGKCSDGMHEIDLANESLA